MKVPTSRPSCLSGVEALGGGAAEMCGVTHKTVIKVVNRAEAAAQRTARRRNYESVRSLVATKIDETLGKISAKRLLPEATAA